jgi:hypothetical protein
MLAPNAAGLPEYSKFSFTASENRIAGTQKKSQVILAQVEKELTFSSLCRADQSAQFSGPMFCGRSCALTA